MSQNNKNLNIGSSSGGKRNYNISNIKEPKNIKSIALYGCLIGDNVLSNNCEAYISYQGVQDQEGTQFPNNTQYTVHILRVYDLSCSTYIPSETCYLEYYDGTTWQPNNSITPPENYGWVEVAWTINATSWIGQWRVRWSTCTKTWQQGTLPATFYMTLNILSAESDVTVYKNGLFIGALHGTQTEIYTFNDGDIYNLYAYADAYSDFNGFCKNSLIPCQQTDIIPSTGTVSSNLTIYAIFPYIKGLISCTSTPSGSEIWLDGVNQGQVTPYTLPAISSGNHNITFKKVGYEDCTVNVNVIAGLSATPSSCTLTQLCTGLTCLFSIT